MKRTLRLFLVLIISVLFSFSISNAGTQEFAEAMRALNALKAMNQVKPLMLNPVAKEKISSVYVEVYDSTGTGFPVDLIRKKVEEDLAQKGYTITESPSTAGYIVQINFTNIYAGKPNKGTSGVGASVLGSLTGYTGLTLGIAGGPLGMMLGSSLGSAVGEAVGEKAEKAALDALQGGKYQFFGTVNIHVVKQIEDKRKEYDGTYPVVGNGEKFSMEDFSEKLVASLKQSALREFQKPGKK